MMRWSRSNPCPICQGHPNLPQGRGVRCYGYLSDHGDYAICTREDHANGLPLNPKDGGYHHRITENTQRQDYERRGPAELPISTTRYELRNTEGELCAVHVRRDYRDGSKRFAWQQPDGTTGLNGTPLAGLPLYGTEKLNGSSRVVLTEGEKAASALHALDLPALGTVSGEGGCPDDSVLCHLVSLGVVLWPDNDDKGKAHMQRIGERLLSLGCKDVRVIHWGDAPPKGDAFDFCASKNGTAAHDVKALVKAAVPLVAAPPPPPDPKYTSVSMAQLMDEWQDEPDGIWETGIPTGITRYDEVTGGLWPGQLIVIGARTGIGKSAISSQIAFNLASGGHPVSFVSLEMTNKQISRRMVGLIADVNMGQARTQPTYYDQHLATITAARAKLYELPIYYGTAFLTHLDDLRTLITKQHEQFGIKATVVDYLGLVANPQKNGNRVLELGTITRGLKLLALELGISIIVPSQLNREIDTRTEGSPPRLSDLRESGSIEQDADVVMLMHRPKQNELRTEFNVAKNREGATTTFHMQFIASRTMFHEKVQWTP